MKLEVKYSSKFKKGLKLAAKRGLDISLLVGIVAVLLTTKMMRLLYYVYK